MSLDVGWTVVLVGIPVAIRVCRRNLSGALNGVRRHLIGSYPKEGCGLLLGEVRENGELLVQGRLPVENRTVEASAHPSLAPDGGTRYLSEDGRLWEDHRCG